MLEVSDPLRKDAGLPVLGGNRPLGNAGLWLRGLPRRRGRPRTVGEAYLTRRLHGLPMRDINEEEFVEFLLWHEVLAASETSRPVRFRGGGLTASPEGAPPVPVDSSA